MSDRNDQRRPGGAEWQWQEVVVRWGDVGTRIATLWRQPLAPPAPIRLQRVAYFQSLGSWDGSTGESSGLWEQWRFLAMQLDQNAATTVTLWLGNNLCDEIFKAMACSQLVARPGNVSLVQVPAIGMRSFVAMHPPGQLAQLFETRKNRPLGLGTRAAHPSSRLLGAVCPT